MDETQLDWGFFGYGDGIVAVTREPGLWRVRVGGSQAENRLLDEALEELLGSRHMEIAALTVRILQWDLGSRGEGEAALDGGPEARQQREVELLRSLLAQEHAKTAPNPLVVRAALDLLAERGERPDFADGAGGRG